MKDRNELLAAAKEARKNSYSPYSGFAVGAALLAESGEVYLGCNVENGAYGDTCCAERVALFSAVAKGERRFLAIAVVGEEGVPCYPCGSCRQALSEFCAGDLSVIVEHGERACEISLDSLLPHAFSFEKEEEK